MGHNSKLSRLLCYAEDYRILTYLSWILAFLSAAVSLLPFWFIWRIMKEVLAGEAIQASNGWYAVLSAAVSFLLYITALLCSHLPAFRIATNIRLTLLNHISKLSIGSIDKFGSGKLRRTISEVSGAAETYLAHQLPDSFKAAGTVIGIIVLLAVFDWRLGLLSLIPVLLAFTATMGMSGNAMKKKITEYQNALADMSNEAVEYIRGIPVVKTFGQTVFSFKRFKTTIDNYEKWTIAYTKQLTVPMMLFTLATNSIFLFLILGGMLFAGKEITSEFILNFIFYIIITPVITLTLSKLMHMSENNMIVADALERIDLVLNEPPLETSGKSIAATGYNVELQNVRFSYDGKKNAIDGISMKIENGQKTCLVGPSGGGKSTILSLIARFYDVSNGKITIGGTDIKDISKTSLMDNMSFVLQNSHLIKGTILDNVKLGRPDAEIRDVMDALKKAECMDIIDKLPDGINTVIGSDGIYLSGGECQRIAIARAILKDAPIILLDEATAYADPDNELKVQKAIDNMAAGHTLIMIAHRLSTVVNADKICVIADGKLSECGPFDELISENGLFSSMWAEYQKSVQWKVEKEEENA